MKKTQVLIVDDDKEYCEELSTALEYNGYDNSVVYCGEDAIKSVKKKKFDIILLDIKMSGIGGIEAFQIIRKLDPDVAIILLTGTFPLEEIREIKSMRSVSYMCKPFDVKKLILKIEEVLKGK